MIPVIDMHCDTISEIHNTRMLQGEADALQAEGKLSQERAESIQKSTELRENDYSIDLLKMKEGGYLCQNFALFTFLGPWIDGFFDDPSSMSEKDRILFQMMREKYETPFDYAMGLSDTFDREMEKNSDIIRPVLTAQDILDNQKNGYLSALKTIEEGGVYGGSIDQLKKFYDQGVRMTTIVWNFQNELGFPNHVDRKNGVASPDTKNGLTDTGKEFVEACFDMGMIVDLSHLNDAGIYDVFKLSGKKHPIVASHSNARTITGHPRNLTDEMLRALGDCGGVAGVNFCDAFMNDRNDNLTTIDDMVRHIRHMENLAGIEAVGLGSDFDGIGNAVEFGNCSKIHQLAEALRRAGYSTSAIEKIFYKNVLRVYGDILG